MEPKIIRAAITLSFLAVTWVLALDGHQSRWTDDSGDADYDYLGSQGMQANRGGQAVSGDNTAIIGPNGILAQNVNGANGGGHHTIVVAGGGNGGSTMGGLPSGVMGRNSNTGNKGSLLSGLSGPGLGGVSGGSMSSGTSIGSTEAVGGTHRGTMAGTSVTNGGTFVSNQGGTIVSSGGSGMSQICTNGLCQTCFNGLCFNRTYPAVRQQGMCAPTACEYGCIEFVLVGDDNCPTCRCNGFSTKQLCNDNNDCDKNGHCEKQLCRYPAVGSKYSAVCDFSYQCLADKECINGKCLGSSNQRAHASTPCVFISQCPSGFGICERMTCWKGGSGTSSAAQEHVSGTACIFDYQCPSGYSCQGMSCVQTGDIHGVTTCVLDSQCRTGERCINMTCRRRPHGR